MQPPLASFIVAGHDNLLLLDGEREGLQDGTLGLEHGGVEAIVILQAAINSLYKRTARRRAVSGC